MINVIYIIVLINLMVLTENKMEQYHKYFNVCHFLIIYNKFCRIAEAVAVLWIV